MRKHFIFVALFGLLANMLMAQTSTLTLRFTGENANNGAFVELESVVVRNISRGWEETIAYPDTTYVLTYTLTGLGSHLDGAHSPLKAYANADGEGFCLELAMPKAGRAQLDVFDMTGRCVMRTSEHLGTGLYRYGLQLQGSSTYIVRATTDAGVSTVKVVNAKASAQCSLALIGSNANAKEHSTIPAKAFAENEFHLGDVMQYVAYAVVEGTTFTSQTILQPQNADEIFSMEFDVPVAGDHFFSVGDNVRVAFSPGNLQYNALADTWRFADNQWDYIGAANANIGQYYGGWIDLFGWGTSGWNCGNTYYQPYDCASGEANGLLYGPSGSNSLTGAYAHSDWGVYNQIGDEPAGIWRTLTAHEWIYLYSSRPRASQLQSHATVNGTHGYIFLPDNWVLPSGVTFTGGSLNWTTNTYSGSEWLIMETAGAVFLPAAGRRTGTEIGGADTGGYWTATYSGDFTSDALYLFFNAQELGYSGYFRSIGRSVRLVKDLGLD